MKHPKKPATPKPESGTTQTGVRIDAQLWIECRKLMLDLRTPPRKFVEAALAAYSKTVREGMKNAA